MILDHFLRLHLLLNRRLLRLFACMLRRVHMLLRLHNILDHRCVLLLFPTAAGCAWWRLLSLLLNEYLRPTLLIYYRLLDGAERGRGPALRRITFLAAPYIYTWCHQHLFYMATYRLLHQGYDQLTPRALCFCFYLLLLPEKLYSCLFFIGSDFWELVTRLLLSSGCSNSSSKHVQYRSLCSLTPQVYFPSPPQMQLRSYPRASHLLVEFAMLQIWIHLHLWQ